MPSLPPAVRDGAQFRPLAEEGIDEEVTDLRTVAPIDLDTVAASVSRTGRLLIAHEAVQSGGVDAELATLVAERCFCDLDAPIARLAPTHAPVPYAPSPERAWLPDVDAIADAVRRRARY